MTEEFSSTSKYGDDSEWESPLDTYIFGPLGEMIVYPAYVMDLTPNALTCISTIFEQVAVFFLLFGCNFTAVIMYLIGYILDCSDGKMARRYKMTTLLGCVLDFNTDMILHVQIYAVIFWRCLWGINVSVLISFVIITVLCNYYYGLAQAYLCQHKTGSDNFYAKYCNDYESVKDKYFYALFLYMHKGVYDTYRRLMPVYNETKLTTAMKVMHYFGPGTYALFLAIIMQFDAFNSWNIDGAVWMFLTSISSVISLLLSLIAGFVSVKCYLDYGRNGKYMAAPIIHYFGLGLGVVVCYASLSYDTVSSWLCMAGGVMIFVFHTMYDIDIDITGRMLRMLTTKKTA